MRRRALLALASGLPTAAWAQRPNRVGFLIAGDAEPAWTQFRKAMVELGYGEGRNVAYEVRGAAASGPLDALAVELVGLRLDVLVAVLSPAIAAARRATSTLTIVFNGGAPETGMIGNVARPEANLTGAFSPSAVVAGKGVQLFHEMKPAARAVGMLLNALDPFHVPLRREVEAVARSEGLEAVTLLVPSPDALASTFEAMANRGVDGVMVQPSLGLAAAATLALKRRLPAFSFRREFAERGGLMSYGADQMEINRAVAAQVDRILKGARPVDLPVRQASRYELIVNQQTAAALGLELPATFLARVDELLE